MIHWILMIAGLVLSFVLLVKGADFFVDGCVSIARLLRVPDLIIGLTIVAMGTSAQRLRSAFQVLSPALRMLESPSETSSAQTFSTY